MKEFLRLILLLEMQHKQIACNTHSGALLPWGVPNKKDLFRLFETI